MSNVRARSPLLRGRSAALAARLVLLAVLWLTLIGVHPLGLAVGLLAVPLAPWASLALEPPGRGHVHPLELLRFLPLCVRWALEGGVDVARRALRPQMAITPVRLEARSRLPGGSVRFFLNSVVSLMPGTLAVEAEGNTLTLHLLDASPESKAAALARLRDLEARVARVFGLPPPPRGLP